MLSYLGREQLALKLRNVYCKGIHKLPIMTQTTLDNDYEYFDC